MICSKGGCGADPPSFLARFGRHPSSHEGSQESSVVRSGAQATCWQISHGSLRLLALSRHGKPHHLGAGPSGSAKLTFEDVVPSIDETGSPGA